MERQRYRRGSRVALGAAAVAIVLAGGGLALHGATSDRTPRASTVAQGAVTQSAVAPTRSAVAPTGTGAVTSPAAPTSPAGQGRPGTILFPVTGPDLPGAAVLDACDTSSRAAVAAYRTRALGSVTMQCGNSSQGYEHIRIRHEQDWTDDLAGVRSRDWDDLMLTAVSSALSDPGPGLPTDAGDGKVCYAARIGFTGGRAPAEGFAKIIVSATTHRVITAYPTRTADC